MASGLLLILAQLATPSPAEAPKPPEAPAAAQAENPATPTTPSPAALAPTVAAPAAPAGDRREPAAPAAASAERQEPRAAARPPASAGPPFVRKPGERPRDASAARELLPMNPGDEPPPSGPVTPPSLTERALCEELHRSTQDRRSTRARMDIDRARLEKLATDIAEARAALKQETARLEALVRKAGPAGLGGGAGAGPLTPAGSERAPVETLARTIRGMQPEQAAAVLARLDPRLAVAVLRRIRPADAGAIADKLKPDTAAALFALMASAAPSGAREAK